MPGPLIPGRDDDTPTGSLPVVGGPPARPEPGLDTPPSDSTGRPLGIDLPDWDLLPPTEFVRRPARGR